ncbi:MAG TPA: hypothetical protein VFR02_06200, partial [bacterium]|nr:hypothetical protein [bacterium]
LTFAMLFLGGSFQVSIGAFYAGAAYLALRAFQNRGAFVRTAGRGGFWLSFAAGAAPLAAQLVPTAEFVLRSARHGWTGDYWKYNALPSLEPHSLPHLLFPGLDLPPGQLMDHVLQNNPVFLSNELYLGVLAPLLVALAFRQPRQAVHWFFLALGATALGLCLGGHFFLHRWVVDHVPGFAGLRSPFRFSYLWTFSFATLAAWGWQTLESLGPSPKLPRRWIVLFALYAAFLSALALPHPRWTDLELGGLGLASLGLVLVFRRRRAWGLACLETALLLPLLLRGWQGYEPAPIVNYDFKRNSAALIRLVAPQMPGRVCINPLQIPYPIRAHGLDYVSYYPENVFAALKLKDLGGYNPLSLQAVDDLRYLPPDKTFKLMAVRGFLVGMDVGPLAGFQRSGRDHFYFYRSLFSGDLVFCPRRWEVLADGGARLRAMAQPAFDPYQEGVLASPLPAEQAARLTGKPADLRYALERDGAEDWTYRVQLRRDGLVVFSQPAYPGWRARVDGTAAPLLTADHALQALFLPAGTHRVEFTYDPWWKPWLPLPWLACLLAGLWLYRRKP